MSSADTLLLRRRLAEGQVIPAHPLALTSGRQLDERHQRALTRYYLAAGAGGVAVGVHTTQFAIRDKTVGLLRPVLELAATTARQGQEDVILVAGICGATSQAVAEAEIARELGYDCGLVSLAALGDALNAELIEHCRQVAEVLPVFGFYLQPAVGGRHLDDGFWRAFAEIQDVVAIKVAPFDRYCTLEVVRALVDVGRQDEIALYTGNDDAIVFDLLANWSTDGGSVRFAGGLLGQWAVGTRRAVELLHLVHQWRSGVDIPVSALGLAIELLDTNAALFDPANRFAGCIPGIHEILRRQGLMQGRWTLDDAEDLSPGQLREIDRVHGAYPHLHDDEFVAANLESWLDS